MEDSINNLGIVTSDKDVNDLAARHCEDAQVSYITMGFDWFRSFFYIFFLLWINFYFHLILRCWRHTGPVSSRNSRRCKRESTESGSLRYMRIWSESVQVICWIYINLHVKTHDKERIFETIIFVFAEMFAKIYNFIQYFENLREICMSKSKLRNSHIPCLKHFFYFLGGALTLHEMFECGEINKVKFQWNVTYTWCYGMVEQGKYECKTK